MAQPAQSEAKLQLDRVKALLTDFPLIKPHICHDF